MKQCTCYALRAIDCTCKSAKYGELYTSPTAKQEQGEPVAITITGKLGNIYSFTGDYSLKKGDKVYTTPQPASLQNEAQRKPLTDEVIRLRGEIGVLVGLLKAALQVIDTVDGADAAECEMLMELQNKITYAIQGAST